MWLPNPGNNPVSSMNFTVRGTGGTSHAVKLFPADKPNSDETVLCVCACARVCACACVHVHACVCACACMRDFVK